MEIVRVPGAQDELDPKWAGARLDQGLSNRLETSFSDALAVENRGAMDSQNLVIHLYADSVEPCVDDLRRQLSAEMTEDVIPDLGGRGHCLWRTFRDFE